MTIAGAGSGDKKSTAAKTEARPACQRPELVGHGFHSAVRNNNNAHAMPRFGASLSLLVRLYATEQIKAGTRSTVLQAMRSKFISEYYSL